MDTFKGMQFAVVGAGLGGCSIAALLQSRGYDVTIYEQAEQFKKLGAGIHLSPNVVRLLDDIGICQKLISEAAVPHAFVSRALKDDKLLFALPLGDDAYCRYGFPYLTVHRGDFHAALVSKVDRKSIKFGKKLLHVTQENSREKLTFEDGSITYADIVIGADGLNSRVRASLRGDETPTFGNQVVFRGHTPINRVTFPGRFELTKWWDSHRFLISYFMEKNPQAIYFVAGIPWEAWDSQHTSISASRDMLVEHFGNACTSIRELTQHAENISLWPLYERQPITDWGTGNTVLLGDACHPMRPHMAQGAAMAIEDAALFVRLLDSGRYQNLQQVLKNYCELRLPRTTRVQSLSSANEWLKTPTDPDWLYGYDAFNCDISMLKTA